MGFTESTMLSTDYGDIECRYYHKQTGEFCLVLIRTPMEEIPFVRIHSSCLFSETFHSNDCDCARQLDAARKQIVERGGVIVYLFQEGRGIGLEGKMKAITLEQSEGVDTAEAFSALGFTPDPRAYDLAMEALSELGVGPQIALATNNPSKVAEVEKHGFKVVSRVRLEYETNDAIDKYLEMKQRALHHYEAD